MVLDKRSGSKANLWVVTIVLVLLLLLLSLASYLMLAVEREGRFDFYPRWVGARAVLSGESPYSDEVTWRIQEGMFGRRLQPAESQQRFYYLATITWLLLPFWLLPFPVAVSIWCGLQFLLLLLSPLLALSLLGWRIRPTVLVVLLWFSIVMYRYPINTYLLGQFIPFSLACLIVAWWGLVHRRAMVATAALIMATVRPEIVVFPLMALLVEAWLTGYRRIVIGWGVGLGVTWLMTRWAIGPWEMDFLEGLFAYRVDSSSVWPPSLLHHPVAATLVVVAALGWGAWMWHQLRRSPDPGRLAWLLSVSAPVGLIVFPQTGNYTLITGLIAAWVGLWVYRGRPGRWIPIFGILSSPWIFLVWGGRFSAWEQLLIPLALSGLVTASWFGQRVPAKRWCRSGPENGILDCFDDFGNPE